MSTPKWPTYFAYRDEVTSDVECAIQENITVEDLNDSNEWRYKDALTEALESVTDNTCIYTSTQHEIMNYTDNDDAVFEVQGEIHGKSWDEVVAQCAYYAYRADLFDYLFRIDDDDIARILGVVQCDECDEWRSASAGDCSACAEETEDEDEDESEEVSYTKADYQEDQKD
jgi:hypothetical protein